jgi:hypothetical protein
MKFRIWSVPLAIGLAAALAVSSARAHFVWVAVEPDTSGQPAAHVWFGELAEPDSAELLDKIAAVKVWRRPGSGQPAAVSLAKQTQGNGGAWVGGVPAGTPALSAHINYGVLTKRDQTFLLHYHAKYLDSSAANWKALSRDEKLALDIVPQAADKGYKLDVLYQGKPAAGAEVVVFDPVAAETTAKTDAEGRFELPAKRPGLYSIRAKWVVTEAGEQDGKEYPQVFHYSTLALRVPESQAQSAAATPTAASASAADLIHRARQARAVWHDFPGFEADLTLFAEGREQKGKVRVAADGTVTLEGIKLQDERRIVGPLRSLVAHRMPGGESDDDVSFADQQADHPLGRLIKLDYDSAMASAYRIKDDVIREVNRQMDEGRFTISVFDVNRNREGKYLPGFYTVNFWNEDGSLRSSHAVYETWARVGDFDLPAAHAAVYAAASEHRNVSMTFENHRLLK